MSKNVPNRTKSVAEEVRELLLRRPFLMNALRLGVVNYSALARLLRGDIGASTEAIKAAIMREKRRRTAEEEAREKGILDLLKKTKITLRDKVAIVISKTHLEIPYMVRATLSENLVYLVDQTNVNLDGIKNASVAKDMVALILTSPEEIERVSGFVAFVTQLLASRGVNIREFISCYTDTIIVLRSSDAVRAFTLLQQFT